MARLRVDVGVAVVRPRVTRLDTVFVMSDPAGHAKTQYKGPPKTVRPPQGWKVPEVIKPAPPRELPEQDHEAIDSAESMARTLTHGVAIIAGSLMFIVLLVVVLQQIG